MPHKMQRKLTTGSKTARVSSLTQIAVRDLIEVRTDGRIGQIEIEIRPEPGRVAVLRKMCGEGTLTTSPDRLPRVEEYNDHINQGEIDSKKDELVAALFSPLANELCAELNNTRVGELSIRAFAQSVPGILKNPMVGVVEELPPTTRKGLKKLAKLFRELAEFMESGQGRSALFHCADGVIEQGTERRILGAWKTIPGDVVKHIIPVVENMLELYKPKPPAAKSMGDAWVEARLADEWKRFIGRKPGRSKSGASPFDRALKVISDWSIRAARGHS